MDKLNVHQAIKEARPKLSRVSPLVAKIVIGFGIFNLLLGWGLITTQATLATPLVIAPTPFAYQLWGGAFAFLGVLMLWGYQQNKWKFMRQTFVIGITFKFAWAIALVIRYVSGDFTNPFLLIVWVFTAYIQAIAYVHFMPTPKIDKGVKNVGF